MKLFKSNNKWSGLLVLTIIALSIITYVFYSEETPHSHPPNIAIIKKAETLVLVKVEPQFDFSFDIMKVGVLQHLDRDYTYDIVPPSLEGGFLFQGIHRPPKGTIITMEVIEPTVISFFFHSQVDGGYSKLFVGLDGWTQVHPAPQYDIYNGTHGQDMTLFKYVAMPGVYTIPATTEDRACFSIVFQKK